MLALQYLGEIVSEIYFNILYDLIHNLDVISQFIDFYCLMSASRNLHSFPLGC